MTQERETEGRLPKGSGETFCTTQCRVKVFNFGKCNWKAPDHNLTLQSLPAWLNVASCNLRNAAVVKGYRRLFVEAAYLVNMSIET